MKSTRIIIVAYHSEDDLSRCLPALIKESKRDAEIVVVDNSSCEKTKKLVASFPEIIYIDAKENLGFAKANNLGAKDFNGEFLCFLNPDTEVKNEVNSITKLAEFLHNNPKVAVVGPLVKNTDGSRQMSFRRWPSFKTAIFNRYSLITKLFPNNPWSKSYLMSNDNGEIAKKVDWVSGCCLMVRKETFTKIGGFNEEYFMFCEDTALCKSISLLDDDCKEIWFCPTSIITHHIGKSISEKSIKIVYERHRSMWIYFKDYNPHWIFLSPITILGLILRTVWYSIKAINNARK